MSSCFSHTYKLFKSLAASAELTSTSDEDSKYLMSQHKNRKPNSIARFFKLNSRNSTGNKIISQYIVELQILTQYCDHGTVLKGMLRDRPVYGHIIKKVREIPNHCKISRGCY